MRIESRLGAFLPVIICMGTLIPSVAVAYERPGQSILVTVTSNESRPPSQNGGTTTRRDEYRTSMTPDGRYVAFTTHLQLVPQDDNGDSDVYLRDLVRGTTELVSKASDGTTGSDSASLCTADECAVSFNPSISGNGRYVAYGSFADNLVPGDLNLTEDIFVYDRRKGSTELVSANTLGLTSPPNPVLPPASFHASIDDSGRFVSFSSLATDFVEGDTNGSFDVFVRDMVADTTRRVSVSSSGAQSTGSCFLANCLLLSPVSSISGNGHHVAFDSLASDLVEGDTNGVSDVFLHDLRTGATERVSVTSGGGQAIDPEGTGVFPQFGGSGLTGDADTVSPARVVSRDGRFVVFVSRATNLVPNDHNRIPSPATPQFTGRDIFVHDRKTGRTERVSVTSQGLETNYLVSPFVLTPSISGSGRYVTFYGTELSDALVEPGSDLAAHFPYGVVIHDRSVGMTEFISKRPDGSVDEAALYGDVGDSGRFVSWAGGTSTTTFDNEPIPEDVDPHGEDVWVRDRGAEIGSWGLFPKDAHGLRVPGPTDSLFLIESAGDSDADSKDPQTDLIGAQLVLRPERRDLFLRLDISEMGVGRSFYLYGARFAVGGIRFELRAQAVSDGNLPGVQLLGLFRCSASAPLCEQVGSLKGSIGTVGEAVVISVPLDALGLQDGGVISGLETFSAIGTFASGPLKLLDTVRLD